LPHVPTTHLVPYSGCEARHALHDRKLPISTAGCRRSRQITRPLRPRSADRTRSLAAVSQKREFFKYLPETIGYFAPRMANIGAQKLVANSQKPAIGGPFSERRGHFLRAPDWLAGVRGFELTHSRSNPVPICPSVNLGIWASRTTRQISFKNIALHCLPESSGPSGVRTLFGRFRRLAVIPENAPPHWRKMLPQRNPFSAKMFPVTAISPTFFEERA